MRRRETGDHSRREVAVLSSPGTLADESKVRRRVKVAYVLSRFPLVTETFILREFDRVSDEPGIEVELYSLFRSNDDVVHAEAEPWVPRCHRPSLRAVIAAAAFWVRHEPVQLAAILGTTLRDYGASPRRLGKALATAAIALQHARHMKRAGIDHIHAHFATYPALTAWVVHRLLGLPYSVTPHAHDIFIDQSGLRTKLGAAEAIMAVSGYHWMFLQHFGAPAERLRRISYGLDLETYAFEPRPIPDDGDVDVIVISSFKPYKGHRVLLEALAGDSQALRRLRVEFIGTGPREGEIRALADSLGVAAQCRFSGARDQRYVRRRLSEAHLLIQPSLVQADGDTEGLPNTLQEAAATGVAMVGTRVAGVPELVEDGVTGFLAEPASATSLEAALRRALGAGRAVHDVQRAARRRMEVEHDLNKVSAALVAAFSRQN